MRKLYNDRKPLFQPENWQVSETDFKQEDNKIQGIRFRGGDGYIGVRGFFEEGFIGDSAYSDPVTMLNGVYEYHELRLCMAMRPGFPDRTQVITRQTNPLDVVIKIDGRTG